MEPLACKCSQCDADLGRFINLWTQIGKSYVTPIVAPDESHAVTANGPTRVGDQNTLVSGCQLQDISCSECNSVLGLKCCHSPVNHVLEDNQLLLRLASVRLVNAKSGRAAKLAIKRHLKLKDPADGADGNTPAKPDTSAPYANGTFMPPQAQQDAHQPQLDPVDLTGLQAYLESQRADISRIDTAGYQIIAAFDSAMDRVEREVKRLQDTMTTVRRELEGNRDDVSSLKTSVDTVREDSQVTSSETKALSSELQNLRQSVSASGNVEKLRGQLQDALAGLRQSSLDSTSEANDLRRELALTKAELRRVKDDQAALGKQVDETKRTSKEGVTANDHARETSALRSEMRQLRQEAAAHKPPNHSQAQNGSFSTRELDILTRNIAKIGNRASQIETLQMEFQLFKSRLQRLETAKSPPARDEYDLPPLTDDEAEQHQDDLAKASAQRRKRPPASREKAGRESTPYKRLAFSSDAEGEGPDFAALGSPSMSPLGTLSARGRATARRGPAATRSAGSGVSGRKVRGRLRKSLPGD